MDAKPPINAFQDVHQKIAVRKEEMRKARESATGMRQRDAVDEAVREGFDRPATKVPGFPDDKNNLFKS